MTLISLFKLVFWAAVLVLALSYFGISIKAILSSPAGQENIAYLSYLLSQFWDWVTYWIRSIPQ